MNDTTVRIGFRRIPTIMIVNDHEVPCILDTGAMTCCVPDEIMRDMGAVPVAQVNVGGAISHQTVPAYRAKVGIKGLDQFSEEVEVIGLSTDTALLGFNLIQRLRGIDINFEESSVTFHAYNGARITHNQLLI